MGSSFSCLMPAGVWGGIYSEVLQKRDLRVEEQLLTCASSSPKFQSEDSYWALAELHSLTPPLSCLRDPATVPSAITVAHTSLDENCKHNGKSPRRAAHAPLWVKTPHTGSGTSFIAPCEQPSFVSPSCERGNLGSRRVGGLGTASSNFLVTFPPFSVHS